MNRSRLGGLCHDRVGLALAPGSDGSRVRRSHGSDGPRRGTLCGEARRRSSANAGDRPVALTRSISHLRWRAPRPVRGQINGDPAGRVGARCDPPPRLVLRRGRLDLQDRPRPEPLDHPRPVPDLQVDRGQHDTQGKLGANLQLKGHLHHHGLLSLDLAAHVEEGPLRQELHPQDRAIALAQKDSPIRKRMTGKWLLPLSRRLKVRDDPRQGLGDLDRRQLLVPRLEDVLDLRAQALLKGRLPPIARPR